MKDDDTTECAYLRHYYPKVAENPVVLWPLDTACIQEEYPEAAFESSLNDRGDVCHWDLKNLSDNKAIRIYKKRCPPTHFLLCEDGNLKELPHEQLPAIHAQ